MKVYKTIHKNKPIIKITQKGTKYQELYSMLDEIKEGESFNIKLEDEEKHTSISNVVRRYKKLYGGNFSIRTNPITKKVTVWRTE